MAVQNISYATKVDLNETEVADINKVKAEDMNEIKGVVNNNGNEVEGLHGETVWANENVTAPFAAQTISLSKSLIGYAFYEIRFRQSTSNKRTMSTGKIPVGNGTILNLALGSSFFRPTETEVTGNNITLEDCHTSSGTDDNTMLIPSFVIAYKG